jgi:hypothetical protein
MRYFVLPSGVHLHVILISTLSALQDWFGWLIATSQMTWKQWCFLHILDGNFIALCTAAVILCGELPDSILDACRPSVNYSTSIDDIDRRRFEALRGSTYIDKVTGNGKAAGDGEQGRLLRWADGDAATDEGMTATVQSSVLMVEDEWVYSTVRTRAIQFNTWGGTVRS